MRSNGRAAAHSANVMIDEACANIDYKYGPYDSVSQAFEALSDLEACAVGLTVGVFVDGKIKEYWFESSCANQSDLVEKSKYDQLIAELSEILDEINGS